MIESNSQAEYLALFDDDGDKIKNALDIAHKIRTFEIELYWKRATYFWAIVAVAFAGYFTAQNSDNLLAAVLIGYIGLILSTSWYLVNRGGSSWQQNWENHVDLLEDSVSGPIYKTLINRKLHRFWDLPGPYSFSPTRINSIVSMFLTVTWVPLILKADFDLFSQAHGSQIDRSIAALMGVTAVGVWISLFRAGKAKPKFGEGQIQARTRQFASEV